MRLAKKSVMTLSDKFCVERHKKSFLDLVKNKLDIAFANEKEIIELINAKSMKEVITFAKQTNKLLVITRSDKGSMAIQGNYVYECEAKKN
jgi:fructokinase